MKQQPQFNVRMRAAVLFSLLCFLTSCQTLSSVKTISKPVLAASLTASSGHSFRSMRGEAADAYRRGCRSRNDAEKLDNFLEAARLSLPAALQSNTPSDERKIYNAACAEAAILAHRLLQDGTASEESIAGGNQFPDVRLTDVHSRQFSRQSEVTAADQHVVRRLEKEVKLEGIGGAVVAFSPKDSELYREDPNTSLEGRAIALNSLVRFPGPGKATIEIRDPGVQNEIPFNGRTVSLTADFTTPLAVATSGGIKGNMSLQALFKPADFEEIRGLTFSEPFEEGQIPVVFIHGLKSLPRVWVNCYTAMLEDEKLRENYQFWYYRYPTGYGIGLNSHEFRTAFAEAMQKYDPGRQNRSLNQAILVGHSMGGLLTSISIRSSGNRVWNYLEEQDPETSQLEPVAQKQLRDAVVFEPIPQVRRAVFVATPHRGSKIASGFGGKLGNFLIKLPFEIVGTALDTTGYLAGLPSSDDDPDAILRRKTSIEHLEPDAWELNTLLELPISSRVTTHSIIGMEKEAPLEESTDGVVPYTSAHLEGVESELVVESDHGVPESPEAVAELKRILHLHLRKLGR